MLDNAVLFLAGMFMHLINLMTANIWKMERIYSCTSVDTVSIVDRVNIIDWLSLNMLLSKSLC